MSKYSKEKVDEICSLLSTGEYTIDEICAKVGITKFAWYEWKDGVIPHTALNGLDEAQIKEVKDYFPNELKKADKKRLATIAVIARRSLIKQIEGYDVEEKSTTYIDDGKGKPKIKETKITTKHFQPNVTATIFALKNTDSENFKDNIDISSLGEKIVQMPPVIIEVSGGLKSEGE